MHVEKDKRHIRLNQEQKRENCSNEEKKKSETLKTTEWLQFACKVLQINVIWFILLSEA